MFLAQFMRKTEDYLNHRKAGYRTDLFLFPQADNKPVQWQSVIYKYNMLPSGKKTKVKEISARYLPSLTIPSETPGEKGKPNIPQYVELWRTLTCGKSAPLTPIRKDEANREELLPENDEEHLTLDQLEGFGY